mmetsp:Transcript_16335/g.46909  ORF Transcript_16335/g.46909 Transcript_16335/m.46909 type:complete len:376 (+) Transcript_16335:58-1185(+)
MVALALTLAFLGGESTTIGYEWSQMGGLTTLPSKICARRRPPRPRPVLLASVAATPEGANDDVGKSSPIVDVSHQSSTMLSKEERRQQSRTLSDARATCPLCRRPPSSCVCSALPPNGRKIALPHVDILILQHPSEFRRKHVSTVPLIPLVLENVEISVGRAFDDVFMRHMLEEADALGQTPLLLFPGPDAITLEDPRALEELQSRSEMLRRVPDSDDEREIGPGSSTAPSKFLLILIDGTWTQASSMVRKSSPLLLERCLPIQFLSTEQQSLYHSMRKQPDAHCLSTLEACGRTLPMLERLAIKSFKNQVEDSGVVDELEKTGVSLANEAICHLHEALGILVNTQLKYEKESILSNRSMVRDPEKMQEKWMRGN